MPKTSRQELSVVGEFLPSVIEKLAHDYFGTGVPGIVAVMNFVQKLQSLLPLE
jgi:hypothetical protein